MNQNKENDVAHLPIDLHMRDGEYFVVSIEIPRDNLRDPFLLDSLAQRFKIADISKTAVEEQAVLVRPMHYDLTDPRIKLIPLDVFLSDFQNKDVDEKKLNFIFHMSRCGSTLASQMLAAVDRFYVVSEPTIVLAILNPMITLPSGITRKQLLKSAINAICVCKPDHCERVFIKFRSWNILSINEILELYLSVRWMFTHRNGIEVLESVLRDPPGWMRSRHTLSFFFAPILSLSEQETKSISDSEYASRLLGVFCKLARNQKSPRSLFLDYPDIASNLTSILNVAWNLNLTEIEKQKMRQLTKMYSKDPQKVRIFEPDSEKKRSLISPEDRGYAEKFVETERKGLALQ